MKKCYRAMGIVCLLLSLFFAYLSIPQKALIGPPEVEKATAAATSYASHAEEMPEASDPIDFEGLKDLNEDIYAWICIPGTDINYPLLQSVIGDNDYYLTHSVDHREDENGCLFTEYLYSDLSFDIPVTVIYGHRRRSGDMFGSLQDLYSEAGSLEKYGTILIYTPVKALNYRVICESEFSNVHIPTHYRLFQDNNAVLSFIEDVKSYHSLNRQNYDGAEIDASDRLLVLSTCLTRSDDQRFLVIARLTEEKEWIH